MVMALVVVGPLLAPGIVLTYDMVFVPKPQLSRELLGVSRIVPRSVPTGLLVSMASRALTGELVQKAVLLAIVGGAALGAARLVPTTLAAARVGAGVLYAWNPFVYERLVFGHWALLLGYAALPWVARAALALRRHEPAAEPRLLLWLVAAALAGPYSGASAAVLAAFLTLRPPTRTKAPGQAGPRAAPGRDVSRRGPAHGAAFVLGAALVANLPWLVPAALHPGVPERPGLAVRLFGARSDSPLGTVGSLLSLGGLWRTDLAPPGRSSFAWIPAFALVAGLAVAGWRGHGHRWPAGARGGLFVLSALGLVMAAAPNLPGLDGPAAWMARTLPGGGALRESQKFVMPFALALAVGFGLGLERALAAARGAGHSALIVATVVLPVLPMALAPTLAWGASGRLFTTRYPTSWSAAERVMAADPEPGGVLILPWHAFLPFSWNRGRTVLQPASQYFSRPVVASSALEVGPYQLPQEDPWARRLDRIADGPGLITPPALAEEGLRYVLLFLESDWRTSERRLLGWEPVLTADDLMLFRGPPPRRTPAFAAPPLAPVAAGDVATVSMALVAGTTVLRERWRRRLPSGSLRPTGTGGSELWPP